MSKPSCHWFQINLANPQWWPNYTFSTVLAMEGSKQTWNKRNHSCTFLEKWNSLFYSSSEPDTYNCCRKNESQVLSSPSWTGGFANVPSQLLRLAPFSFLPKIIFQCFNILYYYCWLLFIFFYSFSHRWYLSLSKRVTENLIPIF